MSLSHTQARVMVYATLLFFSSLPLNAQTSGTRTGTGTSSSQNPVFAIRGKIYSEYTNIVPEILEVKLEKTFTPVTQTYLGSDHSFEFRGLSAGNYNVIIKDERFEDINIPVEIFGQSSQTFYVNGVLTLKKKDGKGSEKLEADDEMGDTVSVTLLSSKVPNRALKLYRKGLELDQKKKYPEAIEELKQALEIFPDFYSAQRNLGVIYFILGNYSASLTALQTASRLNSSSAKVEYFLGLDCLNLNDLSTAQDHFTRVTSLAPQKAGAYYFQGYIYYKQNHLKDAEKSLKKALELDDVFSTYSRLQLANVYMKESQLEEAYHQMEVFLKETPHAEEVSQVMTNLKILREILGPPSNQP